MSVSDSDEDLPPEWEEKISLTNRIYYINHRDKITQWYHPVSKKRKAVSGKLPEDWERKVDEDGSDVFFLNKKTSQISYTDPRLASAYELSKGTNIPRKNLNNSSTTEDVLRGVDLHEKVAIVTGANSGIGYETAKALACHGAHVILACRDFQKAETAINQIKSESPQSKLTFILCDLRSLKSVKHFCDEFLNLNLSLNILILNAAVNGLPYTLTNDGFEATFQVNHLSHFFMIELLKKKLISSAPSRVVLVSSESHRFSTLNVQNLFENWRHFNFISFMAYNDSKLCNILLAKDLHERFKKKQHNVIVTSCHPGNMVYTNLQRYWWFYKILYWFARPFTKSANQGASTIVFCAAAPEIELQGGGKYFNNCQECDASNETENTKLQELLRKKCQDMVNSVLN